MALIVKKEQFLNLFWFLFFLLFFGIPFRKFEIFTKVDSDVGVPLFVLIINYFERLFTLIAEGKFSVWIFLILLTLLLLTIVFLFFLSFVLIKLFEKILSGKSQIFEKVNALIDKLLSVKTIYIIAFLFLISFIPRLIYINGGLLHHDSVQTAIATEKTLETGKLHGITENRYGYIIINVIAYAIPHYMFGITTSEFVVTLVTILFASFSVIMLYLFVKEITYDKYIAISSALVLAFLPIYFALTTYAKELSVSMFFILSSFYFLIKAIKIDLARYKVLFGLSLGYSLFVRVSDVFISIPILLIIYLFADKFLNHDSIMLRNKYHIKNIAIMSTPFFFALLLFLIVQGNTISSQLTSNQFLNIRTSWFDFFITLLVYMPPIISFLLTYGIFYLTKEKRYLSLCLTCWFLAILFFYSSFATSKLRFFVPLLAPMSIFSGIALGKLKENYSIVSLAALATAITLMFVTVQPSVAYRHSYSSEKEIALYFANISESNAIIVDEGDNGVFYDYYAKRKSFECPLGVSSLDEIDKALGNNIPIYFHRYCISLVKGTDPESNKTFNAMSKKYDWAEVGSIYQDNYEAIVYLHPKEYKIMKLKKRINQTS